MTMRLQAVVQDRILVFGGYNEHDVLLKSVECLDLATMTSRPLRDMPSAREVMSFALSM